MDEPSPPFKKSFLYVFQQHYERYPLMELDDFYKLAHQARFGPEHMVPSAEVALQDLRHEAGTLDDGPAELMFDPITPDGRVMRVHLRPYLAEGRTLEQLADSFVRTAKGFNGSGEAFMQAWSFVVALATKGLIPFSREAASQIWLAAQANGFPAARHSESYRRAYRPAYRVIARDFWP